MVTSDIRCLQVNGNYSHGDSRNVFIIVLCCGTIKFVDPRPSFFQWYRIAGNISGNYIFADCAKIVENRNWRILIWQFSRFGRSRYYARIKIGGF